MTYTITYKKSMNTYKIYKYTNYIRVDDPQKTMLLCESYAIITVSVTILWLIVGRNLSLSILSMAMYFPTIAYLVLTKESWGEVVSRCMGSNSVRQPMLKYNIDSSSYI